MRARGGQLRGLAAGRRAKVGDPQSLYVAEQARRQRGGRVLHPPLALGIAGQFRNRAGKARDAHRSGRQDDAAKGFRPAFAGRPSR